MSEKGILFKPDMIRAVQEGRKTQTRRVIELKHPEFYRDVTRFAGVSFRLNGYGTADFKFVTPRYQVGDLLYIKEPYHHGIEWDDCRAGEVDPLCGGNDLWYADDGPPPTEGWGKLRSTLFMPRWVARRRLRVTKVKDPHRIQDISEEDAEAEGIVPESSHIGNSTNCIAAFAELWNSINCKPKPVREKGIITHYVSYPWEDIHETREHRGKPWVVCGNPFVFPYIFERAEK